MRTGEIRQRLEDMAGSANEAELRWRLGEWLTDLSDPPERPDALRDSAAWLAEAGYPIEFVMPDLPLPDALWEALVDVIHADAAGKWHGNELSHDEVASWLASEATR